MDPPSVDRRVLAAAAEVFGEDGWGKFTVDSVARRAGVGKASIYLRWPDKKALLTSALAARIDPVADIDTGSVRDDLRRLPQPRAGHARPPARQGAPERSRLRGRTGRLRARL